jgi:protein-disulfide isomerase
MTKFENHSRKELVKQALSKKTAVLIAFIVFILVAAVIAGNTRPAEQELSGQKYEVPTENDYWLGTSTPRVTIVEFSDFACPYCRNSYTTIREIGIKYGNSVKIILKDFPIHENSLDLAMAARCAGGQKNSAKGGLFWAMHDKLFSLQGQFSTSSLPDLAVSIGADANLFKNCLDSRKYLADIQKDYLDGESLGLKGTPTFFFNGYRIDGEIPKDQFEKIINQFLR